jgi:pimeloyl-ACP methyl ester carboxylesterase
VSPEYVRHALDEVPWQGAVSHELHTPLKNPEDKAVTVNMFAHTAAAIDWYCEVRGSGPPLVLIPSGEGDCASFDHVAHALADAFTVLTFDMPGFSRSSAPPQFDHVTPHMLAAQVAALVTSLHLVPATFYGCSSGGQTVLSLVADHPEVVRNILVHEAALLNDVDGVWREMIDDWFDQMNRLDDAGIVQTCKRLFRHGYNDNPEAWDNLGAAYHQRLEKNYVTWVRHYLHKDGAASRSYSAAELSTKPIAWSVGGFSEVWRMSGNFKTAQRVQVDVDILPCKHFPQVSIPDVLAKHIRENTKKHLGSSEQSGADSH